jgi:hypothetical protein
MPAITVNTSMEKSPKRGEGLKELYVPKDAPLVHSPVEIQTKNNRKMKPARKQRKANYRKAYKAIHVDHYCGECQHDLTGLLDHYCPCSHDDARRMMDHICSCEHEFPEGDDHWCPCPHSLSRGFISEELANALYLEANTRDISTSGDL